MSKFIYIITLCFYLICSAAFTNLLPAQQISINEFMSSNNATIADEDGDFSDWIEIYYGGEKTISLAGYGLSDTYEYPFRWIFPDVTMFPGQYLIVWASGKDRTIPGSPLHTNFSIKSDGEELLLTHPDGTLISDVLPVCVPTDMTFGRFPDGADEWFYFPDPTPGAANTTQGYHELLSPPVFSHTGGFYPESFYLHISHPDPDVIIIYTTDGSMPDTANLGGKTYQYKNHYPENPGDPFGEFYTGLIQTLHYEDSVLIYDRSSEPDKITNIATTWRKNPLHFPSMPVNKGTVVRAMALKEGSLRSPVITHTFFISDFNSNPYSLKVVALCLNEDLFFDYSIGNYVAGIDFDTWRIENPDEVSLWVAPSNYFRRGDQCEFPSHIELFDQHGDVVLKQDIGISLHGGWSRHLPAKSLRLYARSDYGKSSMEYQFFPELEYNSYKRLLLRTSGQDWPETLFRDASFQTIVSHLDFDTQAYEPTIVFLNGEFWGIQNLREHYDKHYLERVYGIDPSNIDFLESNSRINEGDSVHYHQMRAYMDTNDLSDPIHYEYIKTQMDIENFVDYQAAEIFSGNEDWPANNIKYWRLRTDGYQPQNLKGHDGRWRWMMLDIDGGFGHFGGEFGYTYNNMVVATDTNGPSWPNPPWSTFLFRRLLTNQEFTHQFINRFADLMNTTFLPERTVPIIYSFKERIEPEVLKQIQRWNFPENIGIWNYFVNGIISFCTHRPTYQRQHIQEYFNLPGMWQLQADVSNRWHGHIRVNTVHIAGGTAGVSTNPYPWEGIYFKGVPVELEAVPKEGYAFSHWDGGVSGAYPILILSPDEDISVKAHFIRVDIPRLVTFWLFDSSLPNDTPLEQLDPLYDLTGNATLEFHSALAGYPFNPDHPNWRKASMERRNAPTPINYRPKGNNNITYENSNMRAIQVKQPFTGDSGENMLLFHTPTNGYWEMTFSFAAKDEGAAENLLIEYSVAEDDPVWTSDGLANPTPELDNDYELYVFSFENIEEANDNPHFKIRIRFTGNNMSFDEGNRVIFNNFTMDGISLLPDNLPPFVAAPFPYYNLIEMTPEKLIDLNDIFMDPDNDTLSFTIESEYPEMVEVTLDGSMMTLYPHRRGGSKITLSATDNIHPPVEYVANIGIHPAAFPLRNNKFTFTEWSPDEPDFSYPENILFVQSEVNYPGLYDPMPFPYYIPHDDYHFEDLQNIGFPYSNSYLTRINGLDDDGISFVNTGEGRDVGGLLLALDTRMVTFADLNWIAQTILESDRAYALRVQYRTDINDPFTTFLYKSSPLEYISSETGDAMEFEDIPLPSMLLDKPYVQLLWKYYLVGGTSGEFSQLRLDDIIIQDLANISDVEQDEIRIFAHGSYIYIRSGEKLDGHFTVYDVSGRLLKSENLSNIYYYNLIMHPSTGIFIVRYVSNDQVYVRKVFIE